MTSAHKVATPPPKPLMVFDGDCRFCSRWVRRWNRMTGESIDYLPFQDAAIAARFPEIPRRQFEESVQLLETDGSVYNGAEAVYRSLAYAGGRGRLFWMYRKVPGFACVSELAYRFVARNRSFFSALTGWLPGRE